MRNREPETAADVIRDLCDEFGLNPDQRISTLEKACEDIELDDDDELDDDLVDELDADYEDDDYEDAA